MTTVREFSEEIGLSGDFIRLAIFTLKKAEIWPGEDLFKEAIICERGGREVRRRVRSLTEEQMETIENELLRMGENERAWNKELKEYAARARGKEQVPEGGIPEGACSPRGQERDWHPHFIG